MINDYESENENQQTPFNADIPSVVMVLPIFTHKERPCIAGVKLNKILQSEKWRGLNLLKGKPINALSCL